MSKQTSKKQPTSAERIAHCEADIVRLEKEREAHISRGAELAEQRKAISYRTHVQHDPESRKQLDAINVEIGTHGSELRSFDDAISTARTKLAEAQAVAACEEERASIAELRKKNDEVRKLGPWLDRNLDGYVGGLRGLLKVAGLGLPHPTSGQQVLMLYRCFLVAIRGTPWEREFGVADASDKKTFGSHAAIIDQWCDANERAFKYRLAALDNREKPKTEAA